MESRHKTNQYWEPDVEYPALRQPLSSSAVSVNGPNYSPNNNSVNSDIVKHSNLSVDAKEFYPASYTQTSAPTQFKSVQDRLSKYKHIDNNVCEPSHTEAAYNNSDYLTDAIYTLSVKPGKFDSILPTLLENLEPYFEDADTVFHITGVIFNQV